MDSLNKIGYVASVVALLFACDQKELDLNPSEPLEAKYSVPQGTGVYDQKIVDFYDRTGCMLLYKYDMLDLRWNITALNPSEPVRGKMSFFTRYPKLEELDKALEEVLWGQLFDRYPEEFLVGRLPRYLFLADSIIQETEDVLMVVKRNTFNVHRTETGMTVGRINDDFLQLTSNEQKSFRQQLNTEFWNAIVGNDQIVIPEKFYKEVDYLSITTTNAKEMGILHGSVSKLTVNSDFLGTVKAVLSFDKQLVVRRLFAKTSTADEDPKGMRAKRFNIFLSEMKRMYDVDFEKIVGFVNPVKYSTVAAFHDPMDYPSKLICFTKPVDYAAVTSLTYKKEGIIWEFKTGDLINSSTDFQKTLATVYGFTRQADLNKLFTTTNDPEGRRWERFGILFKELATQQEFDFKKMTDFINPYFDMPAGFGEGIDYSKVTSSTYKKEGIIWDLGAGKIISCAEEDFRMTLVSIYGALSQTTINGWFLKTSDPNHLRWERCKKLVEDIQRIYGVNLEEVCAKELPPNVPTW